MGYPGGDLLDQAVRSATQKHPVTPQPASLEDVNAILFGDTKKKSQSSTVDSTDGSNSSTNGSASSPPTPTDTSPEFTSNPDLHSPLMLTAQGRADFQANPQKYYVPEKPVDMNAVMDKISLAQENKNTADLTNYLQTKNTPEAKAAIQQIQTNNKAFNALTPDERNQRRYAAAGGEQAYNTLNQQVAANDQKDNADATVDRPSITDDGLLGATGKFIGNTAVQVAGGLSNAVTKTLSGAVNMIRDHGGVAGLPLNYNNLYNKDGTPADASWTTDPLGKMILGLDGQSAKADAVLQHYQLPDDAGGHVVQGIATIAPDIAVSALAPEAKAAEITTDLSTDAQALRSLGQHIWNPFTKWMIAKGFGQGYAAAKQAGDTTDEAMQQSIISGAEGLKGGAEAGILGGIGGKVSEGAFKGLVDNGAITKNGIILKATLDVISDATVFGGYPLLSGDTKGAESGAGMGAAFGLLRGYHTVADGLKTQADINDIVNERQTSAMINFARATPEAIAEANQNPTSVGDLNAKAIEYAKKAQAEVDPEKKKQLLLLAQTFAKTSDVKGVADLILNNKDDVVNAISSSEIPDASKQFLIQKINDTHNQLHPDEIAKNQSVIAINDANAHIEANQKLLDNPSADPITKIKAQAALDAFTTQKEDHEKNLQTIITNQINGKPSEIPEPEGELITLQPNEQTAPNTEVPAEQPADETASPAAAPAPVNENAENKPKTTENGLTVKERDLWDEFINPPKQLNEKEANNPDFNIDDEEGWAAHKQALDDYIFNDTLSNDKLSDNDKLRIINDKLNGEFDKIKKIIDHPIKAKKYIDAIKNNDSDIVEKIRESLPYEKQGLLTNRIDDFEYGNKNYQNLKNKPLEIKEEPENAISVGITAPLHVDEAPGHSAEVGGRVSEPKETAIPQNEPAQVQGDDQKIDAATKKAIADKAVELKNKTNATNVKLKEQKADILDQMQEVHDLMFSHVPKKTIDLIKENKTLLSPLDMSAADEDWKEKVQKAGYEVNGDNQIIFHVKDDGVFKVHADWLSAGQDQVKKEFPTDIDKQQPSAINKSKGDQKPGRPGNASFGEYKRDLTDARDNLETATKSSNKKMTDFWQSEVNRIEKLNLNYAGRKDRPTKAVIKATGEELDVPSLKDSEYKLAAAELPNGQHGVFETNSGKLISNLYDTREELLNNFEKNKDKITPDAVKSKVEPQVFIENAADMRPSEVKEADEDLAPIGLTINDIIKDEHEQSERAGSSIEQPTAETNAETVQQPEVERGTIGIEATGDQGQAGSAGVSEREIAIRKEITDKSKIFDAIVKKSIGNIGVGINPLEFIKAGSDLMASYAKLGLYKFGQMLDSFRHQWGDDFVDKNIDLLRKAYANTRDDATDEDLAKFDDDKAVRQYIADNAAQITNKEIGLPTTPENKPEPRDEMADLKTAYNKKKVIEKQTGSDDLLKSFSELDPRYFTPDEVARYNELTKDKTPNQLNRDEIAKFIDDVHSRQDDENEDREKQWYKQLDDDPDFEGDNIKKVLKDVGNIEGNEIELENTKENKTAKSALKKLLRYNRDELRKVDAPEGFEGAKKAILSIDEDNLSTRDLRDINRAIDGMVNDGNFAGSGYWVALDESVKKAAAILDAKNKKGLESGQTNKLPGELRSLPQNIEIITKDSKLASTVQEKSGIFDISAGNSKVNKTMNIITKEFSKLTDGMGKDISSTENRYKRGILATFLQKAEADTPEDHFDRYKQYVEQSDKKLLKSSKKAEQREGELVQSLYDKHIKDATTSDEVVKSLTKDNPNNLKIVKFFIDKQKEVYPALRKSALMYSGKELPLIENYTSTQMKRLRGVDDRPIAAQMITDPASMDSEDSPTNTGQARTTITRRKGMRPDRVMNLNFDGMQLNRLRESHYDVQTLPSRYLYDAIRKQPDFKEALGNSQKNVNVISDGVSTMVRAQLGFNHTDPVAKMVLDITNMIGTAGTRIALKGIDQFAKHYPSRTINTLGNLGSDVGLYFKAMTKIGAGNQPIFDESGIGLRGLSKGGTDIEGSIRQFQKYDFSTAGEWLNAIHKVFNKADGIWSAPLTTSDELVAKHSWAAYYMQDLQKRGIDIDNIDFNTEHTKMDKEAASYAEQMVSRNEIPNDPTQRAIFDQRGDVNSAGDLFKELAKKAAFPFTTYSRNIQVRLENDIRKFNGGNRKEAARSIVSTIAETASFQSIKILLKIATGAAAGYALSQFGFDAPTHDSKKDWKQLPAQTFDDMFLAGLGSTVDGGIKDGINNMYKLAKGSDDVYIFKNYDPGQFGETNFGLAGMYGILPQKIHEATQELQYAEGTIDGEADAYSPYFGAYKQQYESQLTDKQRELAQGVFALDILGIAGMSGATSQRLNTAIFNQIKMQAAPVRFHSGMEHNKKSGSYKVGGPIDDSDDN